MIAKRKIVAGAGVLASLVAVAMAAPAAQAKTVEPGAESTTKITTARATDGSVLIGVSGGSASTRTTAAVPSTSPAVERVFVSGSQTTPCNPGYACAAVPYGGGAYIFKFVHYDGYSVSNWTGSGYFVNNQTGGAGARYDNVSGGQIGCVSAGYVRYGIDWNPVWRVRLTAAAC